MMVREVQKFNPAPSSSSSPVKDISFGILDLSGAGGKKHILSGGATFDVSRNSAVGRDCSLQ